MIWNNLELPDKPYYQDDAVLIYCADCRDILPLLPDKSIDLVLTDPPYGEETHNGARTDGGDIKLLDFPPIPKKLADSFLNIGLLYLSIWVDRWNLMSRCIIKMLSQMIIGLRTWKLSLVGYTMERLDVHIV